jgi:hypothetical protein
MNKNPASWSEHRLAHIGYTSLSTSLDTCVTEENLIGMLCQLIYELHYQNHFWLNLMCKAYT